MAQLTFRFSTMNAGKSTRALQEYHSYKEEGLYALLAVPEADDRDGVGVVASRVGLKHNALVIASSFDLYAFVSCFKTEFEKVIVDEAQFLTEEQVDQLTRICDDLDIPVVCYGLRTDFQMKMFNGSRRLFEVADNIEEVAETICWCKEKAIVNARIDESGNLVREGEQIVTGGNDKYRKICRKHFMEGKPFRC